MNKIKFNIHSWNKHIFLGFSFCVFAIIISIYWGLTYAEDLPSIPLTTSPGTVTTDDPNQTTENGATSSDANATPIAPTNLIATVSGNNVLLNWLDKSDNEAGFKIYRGPTWTDIGNVGPNVTTFTDSNRPAGTYTYKLNAFNSSNIYSTVSNEVSVTISSQTVIPGGDGESSTTLCTSLKLSLGDNKTSYIIGDMVNYVWECAPSGSTGVVSVWLKKPDGSLNIYNTGTGDKQSLGFSTSDLLPGSYILKACLSTSCSPNYPSSTQEFTLLTKTTTDNSSGGGTTTTSTIPIAPSNLSLSQPVSSASRYISLKWSDNSSNEDKWNIARKLSGTTSWVSINQISGSNITSYIDSNVTVGTYYDYGVQACLSGTGCSEYSILERIIIPSSTTDNPQTNIAPVAPSNITKEIIYSSGKPNIKITWKDNSTNESKFIIKRKFSTDSSYSNFVRNINQNTVYYLDSDNITVGLSYDYSVVACSSDNVCSNPIEIKNILIPQTAPSEIVVKENLLIPISPTSLSLPLGTVINELSKFIPLKWNDNSNNEDKWNIERRTNGGVWMYLNQIIGSNKEYYVDYSVIPGNSYDYRVQACLSGIGCSGYSILEKILIPLPKVVIPVTNPTPIIDETKITTTNTITESKKIEQVSNTIIDQISENVITKEILPVTSKEIAETISIISQSPVINEGIKKEISEVSETSKIIKLVYQDTNKDGISDYESKYVYNIDPIKKSPISIYEGKTLNASDKILLGYDPSKEELIKITKEEPINSVAPVVNTYKVNKIELIKDQNKVVLRGQALPNSFLTVYIYSTPIIVTVKTDDRGEWQYLLDKELEDGTHTVYTATVNNTGNIVAQSSPYSFTKTAEAASLKDVPVTGASVGVQEPSFWGTKNIFIMIIGVISIIGLILITMGILTTNKNIKTD